MGVFLWRTPEVSCRDFLTGLETDGIAAMDETGADDRVKLQIHTVKVVSRLLEPTLAKLTAAEVRALEFAALMPSDWVVQPWLKELVGAEFPDSVTRTKAWKPDPWRRLEEKLLGWRLLFRAEQDEPQRARIHPVLQEVLRGRMAAERREREDKLIAHAEGRGKVLVDGWIDREARWEIEPIKLLALEGLAGGDARFVDLANWAQKPIAELGRYSQQRTLLRRALAVADGVPAITPKLVVQTFSNLGLVERVLGNLVEAQRLLNRAIQIEEKHFEHDHPNLAILYSNLGLVEMDLGDLTESRRLFQRAIQIEEKHFEHDHPNLATRYSNLGNVEKYQGNLTESRRLFQRAIQIEEKHFEHDHPNLAFCHLSLGMLEEVEGHLVEALARVGMAHRIFLAKLGSDHANTKRTADDLKRIDDALPNNQTSDETERYS